MAQTKINWGDPKAIHHFSPRLAVDIAQDGYFSSRFQGRGSNNIIEEKTELESDSGDTISFDLNVRLRSEPTFGDARLEGNEEQLRFYTDEVRIDQARTAVSAGGKMTRKRTAHDLRMVARDNLRRYWAKFMDEFHFSTLSGTRGHNEGFIMREGWNGFAKNDFLAPDPVHLLFGGDATSKATITSADFMTRAVVERAAVHAEMLQAVNPEATNMVPLTVQGSDHFILLMSPFQEHSMRMDATPGGWLDIQKAAAAAEGAKNKVFRGGCGMINNVILHKHSNAIRFRDYGVGGDLPAARALLLGRQAEVIAYGTSKGNRFTWKEMMKDYDNEPSVAGGYIFGGKKSRYNGTDFGVCAIDTYAENPNPRLAA